MHLWHPPPLPLATALSMWSSDGENIFLNHDIESLNTDDVLSVVLKIETVSYTHLTLPTICSV